MSSLAFVGLADRKFIMPPSLYLLILALIGSFVALIGGIVFLFSKRWSDILGKYAVPFAAGVLITVSLIGLLPEATEMIGEEALIVVLAAIMASYIFEITVGDLHHHEHQKKTAKASVPLVILGDTIHNFIDGVAIGATFGVNPALGLVTAISTFLHEVPHEIGDFGILLKAGFSRKKVLLVNIFSALMTVPGAFLVYYLAVGDEFEGTLLAIAAGIFMYLGMSDFLPRADKDIPKYKSLLALLLGVATMYLIFVLTPHAHD